MVMLKYFKIFTCCCIIVNLLMFYGACKKEDPYANKMCVKCGTQAVRCVSGVKPVNANENNCELITGSIYRIFYCDNCWESVPKIDAQGQEQYSPKTYGGGDSVTLLADGNVCHHPYRSSEVHYSKTGEGTSVDCNGWDATRQYFLIEKMGEYGIYKADGEKLFEGLSE